VQWKGCQQWDREKRWRASLSSAAMESFSQCAGGAQQCVHRAGIIWPTMPRKKVGTCKRIFSNGTEGNGGAARGKWWRPAVPGAGESVARLGENGGTQLCLAWELFNRWRKIATSCQ
jgi:hypothetical protein